MAAASFEFAGCPAITERLNRPATPVWRFRDIAIRNKPDTARWDSRPRCRHWCFAAVPAPLRPTWTPSARARWSLPAHEAGDLGWWTARWCCSGRPETPAVSGWQQPEFDGPW